MNNKLLTSVGLGATLMLASCGGQKGDEPTPAIDEQGVSFAAELQGVSRAGDTYFESGDAISVFAVATPSGSSVRLEEKNRYDNIRYVYDNGRFVAAEKPGILKDYEESLAYVAVYPYKSAASREFTFFGESDQRKEGAYTASDLCTAAASATESDDVELVFYHRMSQILFSVYGDDLAGDLDVRFHDLSVSASVDLNELRFESINDRVDILPAINGVNSWKAIVAPQVLKAGSMIATVTLNGKEYPLVLDNNVSLISGKAYEFSVTIVNNEIVNFTGNILPWNSGSIETVVPDVVRREWGEYITIHEGYNPPNVEGCYFIDPFACVYCADYGNGGYAPGDIVSSEYINLSNQNNMMLTLDFEEISYSGNSYSIGKGAFISGSGNDFTVYFNTEGESSGISTKIALVISGTKTSTGIKNLEYAFVMVEKGPDPSGILMEENVYRVFKDEDGLAVNATWPGFYNLPAMAKGTWMPSKLSRVK